MACTAHSAQLQLLLLRHRDAHNAYPSRLGCR
ncbi:Uncharacterised protein [Vibrio cholerae]|nr:Uncharacterised protein [Vibrio cholerae]